MDVINGEKILERGMAMVRGKSTEKRRVGRMEADVYQRNLLRAEIRKRIPGPIDQIVDDILALEFPQFTPRNWREAQDVWFYRYRGRIIEEIKRMYNENEIAINFTKGGHPIVVFCNWRIGCDVNRKRVRWGEKIKTGRPTVRERKWING